MSAWSDQIIENAIRSDEKDWDNLVHGLGRNDFPLVLILVWHRLPHDQKVKALAEAWTSAEWPERQWNRHTWIPMFREVGYIYEDHVTTPPFEPITLWRGGVKKTRMSWTADREKAEWFAHRFAYRKPGKLWTVTVEPDRLLARFHKNGRHEEEYVIDPDDLRFREIRA